MGLLYFSIAFVCDTTFNMFSDEFHKILALFLLSFFGHREAEDLLFLL